MSNFNPIAHFGFDPTQPAVVLTEQTTCCGEVAPWPLLARVVARFREDGDTGVGDTIHRQLGQPGAWFEMAANSLGVNCGCSERRAWLNQRYPYHEVPTCGD